MTFRAPDGLPPTPAQAYIKRACPALPGWALRDCLKKRDLRVNGAKRGADAVICAGDEVTLYLPKGLEPAPLRELFCDGRLLIVEKPQGLPVDADAEGVCADTALSRERMKYPSARLCHRLDAATGGALLFSLDDEAHGKALDAFRDGLVEKRYECLAKGAMSPPDGALSHFLLKDAAEARVAVYVKPVPGALSARLRYRTLERGDGVSRLEIELLTGRTHQIRAQLAEVGHPILGDDKYGDRAFNRARKAARLCLWCTFLELPGARAESRADFGTYTPS